RRAITSHLSTILRSTENLRRGLCVAPPATAGPWPVARTRACRRSVVAWGACASAADADAAADPARRAGTGSRSRQPHLHADLCPARTGQRSAVAAGSRHEPEPHSRPGDYRLVYRRAEERDSPTGAPLDTSAARPLLPSRRRVHSRVRPPTGHAHRP